MKNLLFIPCYNCNKQIIRVLNKLLEIDLKKYFCEILIVDNKSIDDTNKVIIDFFNNNKVDIKISLITNKENYGLGGSHKIAFEYACNNKYEKIVVLHGDDQANIMDCLHVFGLKNFNEYDCWLGSRFMKNSKLEGYSKIRILGNLFFNKLFSIILNKKILDLGSGLNIYSIKMLRNKFYINFPNNLTFNYMMILATKIYSHKIEFFPISWNEKDQISNVKTIKQSCQIFSMLFKFIFSRKSLFKTMKENIKYQYNIKQL